MPCLTTQEYWNTIGCNKEFDDPLFIEKFAPFLTKDSTIIEYGCGYGRLLNLLKQGGYNNLKGFDFSKSMIERGRKTHPDLDLRLLENPGILPLPDGSVDALFMSTVLVSMIDIDDQKRIIAEIRRVLKDNGVFYLSDFLVSDDPRSQQKYEEGFKKSGVWGMYQTKEGLLVRHMTTKHIFNLLNEFDVHWFEQFNFKTMNNAPARTFHCVAQKNTTSR
jgi:ubiquinone/menaquinone biosynthesis C-methylase UbiE